jgi:hypothetical protein
MSTPKPTHELQSIDPDHLRQVAGGASRSSGSEDITAALSSIQSSLKDLAGSKSTGSDPMQMILIMMMMGGFGGGGGGGYVGGHAAAGTPPVINVDTGVSGGGGRCRRRGKKGW